MIVFLCSYYISLHVEEGLNLWFEKIHTGNSEPEQSNVEERLTHSLNLLATRRPSNYHSPAKHPYSSDLAPSDYPLLSKLTEHFVWRPFGPEFRRRGELPSYTLPHGEQRPGMTWAHRKFHSAYKNASTERNVDNLKKKW